MRFKSFLLVLALSCFACAGWAQDLVVYHIDNAVAQGLKGLRNLRNHMDADPEAKIAKQYDAKIKMMDMADRVSFVLSPDGKVIFSHTAMSPAGHITETLKAVQAWKAQQTAPAKP